MKKKGILNNEINNIIGKLKHGFTVMIADAGFPIPQESFTVDVSIIKDFPSTLQVLEPFLEEIHYESVLVADEQKTNNPNYHLEVKRLCSKCEIQTIKHEEMLTTKVDFYIRTGSFEPWGNIIITSGIDEEGWFEKEGTIRTVKYMKD